MNPSPNRELSLGDYYNSQIPNMIGVDPSPETIKLTNFGLKQSQPLLFANVCPLGLATGRYNCHGLVLGGRRAHIPPVDVPVDIRELLQREHYTQVTPPLRIGDIVVYAHTTSGEIEHTGYVVRLEGLMEGSQEKTAFIWSKWGVLGEYEHQINHSPYRNCSIEYWRLGR